LLSLGPQAVLLKGGHLSNAEAVDILFNGSEAVRFVKPRVATRNTHGTGCTLSSAITAGLAQGLDLAVAVAMAKEYLAGAIAAADSLELGHGHGPVHHFYRNW